MVDGKTKSQLWKNQDCSNNRIFKPEFHALKLTPRSFDPFSSKKLKGVFKNHQ